MFGGGGKAIKGSEQKLGFYRHKSRANISKGPDERADRTFKYRYQMKRYEMKYRIGESEAAAILQFIKPYLHRDRYCELQPSGSYPVVSLYLDSDTLQLAGESLTGKKNRFKLRVRSYTDDEGHPRFVEIKRRMNAMIIKTRARVRSQDIWPLLSGRPVSIRDFNDTDGETLDQFQLYMHIIAARPVIRVRYLRSAYEGDWDNRVRVTFDRQLAYKVGSEPELSFASGGWQRYFSDGVILEIKFTTRYPVWLAWMVKHFDLRQQSLSKYVSSVKQASLLGFRGPKLAM